MKVDLPASIAFNVLSIKADTSFVIARPQASCETSGRRSDNVNQHGHTNKSSDAAPASAHHTRSDSSAPTKPSPARTEFLFVTVILLQSGIELQPRALTWTTCPFIFSSTTSSRLRSSLLPLPPWARFFLSIQNAAGFLLASASRSWCSSGMQYPRGTCRSTADVDARIILFSSTLSSMRRLSRGEGRAGRGQFELETTRKPHN